MSRTDKDDPIWVRADYFQPRHHYWCGRSPRYACDLPAAPLRRHPHTTAVFRHCGWMPVRDWRTRPLLPAYTGWQDPQRRVVVNQCRRAVQQYNGSGEVDVVPVEPTKRRAMWDAW